MSRAEAPPAGEREDGRSRRSAETRARLVEAVRECVAGGEDPTPERIARRAGVSERTLFRLFGDLPGLWAAVRARMATDVARLLQSGPYEGDIDARVRELVRRRIQVFEAMAPYRSWVDAREVHYPAIRQSREVLDVLLRKQTREALADEIAAVEGSFAPAIDALLTYESWSYLRSAQGLGPRQMTTVLEMAVRALLAERMPTRTPRAR